MKSSMPDLAGPDSDESDSLPEGLEDYSNDESVPMEKNSNEDESDEDDWGSGFEEDEDDLVGSDVDAPGGLLHIGSESDAQGEEEEEWGGISARAGVTGKKRKAMDQSDGGRGKKRQRLRDLPTFASVEQYAKLIDEADEENL
jgi:ribosome biogenesis protein MAK21